MCTLSPSFTTASWVTANSLLFWKVTSISPNMLNIFSDSTLQALKANSVKKIGRYLLNFIIFIINHLINSSNNLISRRADQKSHPPSQSWGVYPHLSKHSRCGKYRNYGTPEYR